MNKIEKAESNWNEARAIAKKAKEEYLDAHDRWQILEKHEDIAFALYIQELREYCHSPYRPLTDGETISDTDQWRFSEQHEWEYFKASVGQIWVGSEWTEGTQTRTLSAPKD
jgi:hypothetical protein